ncbi:hypothetical protein [Actinophytocola xanthii]|nr:hypothetical protein [Actinophytocola xanthii]
MSTQSHSERDTRTAGAPVREAAGQQTSPVTDHSSDDHLIRGYN